jgi:hypothetical protein
MHGDRTAGVLLFFAALLVVASASAAVGAHSGGRVVASHAAAAGTKASARLHTASATLTGQVEDEVAPELSWVASLLKGLGGGAFVANKAVCLDRCAEPGEPYVDHGCNAKYNCRS